MSDKLQEIKLLAQNAMATGTGHVDLTTYALTWLIKQLEQAQAEKEVIVKELGEMTLLIESETYWANLLEQVNTLQADNQKLVACLEWYAEENTWLEPDGAGILPIDYDEGHRARTLLAELKQ